MRRAPVGTLSPCSTNNLAEQCRPRTQDSFVAREGVAIMALDLTGPRALRCRRQKFVRR